MQSPLFVKKINQASMTVEASFVVPLFIFCIINLLFSIQVIETSSRLTAALHETGNEICSYGYAVNEGIGEGIPTSVGSTIYAASSIAGHLGRGVNRRGGIKGGISGISYLGSSVLEDGDIVKLSVTYSLKYPVNMNIRTIRLGTSYYGHAWTGYSGGSSVAAASEEDPIVFITPSGTVYHLDIHCSHLNPSLHLTPIDSIKDKRSNDGSKYYPCEICAINGVDGSVYVTDYGNRYHCDINCSGIKRNVRAVHLSEVKGRRKCMTCG